ncbi:MAG: ATP-binding protein [Elusimicrobiota bacterium]
MLTQKEFDLLLEATRTVNSTLEIKELLTIVIDLSKKVLTAEAASLLLYDKNHNELYFDIALGDKSEKVKTIRLKSGEGIAGWVLQHGQPLLVKDVSKDKRWFAPADKISDFQTRTLLAVPLLYKDEKIGVIEVINSLNRPNFVPSDIPLLQAFAAQAAVALKNAQLFTTLGAERDKTAAVLGGMTDGAVAVDHDDTIIMANKSTCNYLGGTCIEGTNFFKLVNDFEISPVVRSFSEIKAAEFSFELSRKKGKKLYLRVKGKKYTEDGQRFTGSIMVISDVTEEKREEMLKRTFLSLVSHKLKTPLTTIAGYIPLLLSTELTEFQRKALNAMKQQSTHLTILVEKLLNLILVEAEALDLVPKPLILCDLLSIAQEQLAVVTESKNASISLDQSVQDCPTILVDKNRTIEAFKNIIENSIKFSDKPSPEVKISVAHNKKPVVQVIFADNGPGIPPEELRKVFEKFYQIEESFTGQVEGFGLGLALVKRVIESQHGKVWAESKIGEGTKIICELPIVEN